jgi:hypothetical protein
MKRSDVLLCITKAGLYQFFAHAFLRRDRYYQEKFELCDDHQRFVLEHERAKLRGGHLEFIDALDCLRRAYFPIAPSQWTKISILNRQLS